MLSFPKRTLRILLNFPCHAYPFSSDCKKDSDPLKKAIQTEVVKERERLAKFRKEHGNAKVGDITVGQLYGGMRGMLGFVCDTSNLNANTGIQFRGLSIPQIQMCLPKAANGCEPLPEGMWWLLCTGEVPSEENVAFISKQWAKLGKLPDYAVKILKSLPKNLHPMTQFSIGVECLNCNSKFNKAYNENKPRQDRWMYVLEDATDMLAKIPSLAAHIYNNTFRDGKGCYELDPKLDWSGNFCNMLGFDNPGFKELMRLYLTIHSDHEGGNVSAHACHLVGSALSDPYLSFAAGMNGLAGPLHGLANQEVLLWLDAMVKDIGKTPSEEEMKKWIQNFIKTPGKVVPGYGHAVLLVTDPRYDCQADFAKRVIPDDPLVQLVAKVYKVVPPLLKSLGKVRNPWPNVDAHSGVLLRHYGLTQASYYTVLFGVSRAMGLMAQLIWARALMLPIERPDTITTDALMEMAIKSKCDKK